MRTQTYYLIAQSFCEGKLKAEWFEVDAMDEHDAVCGLLKELESANQNVQMICEVIGVKSMQELTDVVLTGFRPGVHYIMHLFEEGET